ncbi:hypothetical protein ZIOFF_003368 [Zingiber officinale]|uniref:Glutaredoxin domain-containing protein n=1 Tax=Zingiber officinale TaxID=94328 RepID=A0A8J5ID76_ZINOF|nr:hypothetical protein ZIOFF_003368 [Zingiber officinale]
MAFNMLFSIPLHHHHHHHHLHGTALNTRHLCASGDPSKRPQPDVVVLYTTSLRAIRRTFEDCRAVRSILDGLGVAVDERDVSMDAGFRQELQVAMEGLRPFVLPQVFVGGRCLGGAAEIYAMHEAGELGRALEPVARRRDSRFSVCGGCSGVRFVPCSVCRGSRKVFVEEEGRARRCAIIAAIPPNRSPTALALIPMPITPCKETIKEKERPLRGAMPDESHEESKEIGNIPFIIKWNLEGKHLG